MHFFNRGAKQTQNNSNVIINSKLQGAFSTLHSIESNSLALFLSFITITAMFSDKSWAQQQNIVRFNRREKKIILVSYLTKFLRNSSERGKIEIKNDHEAFWRFFGNLKNYFSNWKVPSLVCRFNKIGLNNFSRTKFQFKRIFSSCLHNTENFSLLINPKTMAMLRSSWQWHKGIHHQTKLHVFYVKTFQ